MGKTVRRFNPHGDTQNNQRLKSRINRYLRNVATKLKSIEYKNFDISLLDTFHSKLPKKYQPYLGQLAQAYLKGLWKV